MPRGGSRVASENCLEFGGTGSDPLGPLGSLPILQLASVQVESFTKHIRWGDAGAVRKASQRLLDIVREGISRCYGHEFTAK
jgi:hypothetical protein